jgi:TolA-binding protein
MATLFLGAALAGIGTAGPRFAGGRFELANLRAAAAGMAPGVFQVRAGLAARPEQMQLLEEPPEARFLQDPADSLYRAAREALNRGDYARAAEMFRRIRQRYPRSGYAPDAYYWEAFALYRAGGKENLHAALRALENQGRAHPRASTRNSAEVLATRIRGQLAALGDAVAAESVASLVGPPTGPPPRGVPPATPAPPAAPRPPQAQDDDLRLAALNALLQMDAERAIPILRDVLARRDPRSVELRRHAVFLVSQKRTAETEQILLDAARNDPDAEVRAQAVFWLSQVPTERAAAALDSILLHSTDREVQKKAIFALSQHRSDRAGRALRDFIERGGAPDELKGDAIFWLGQRGAEAEQAYLRQLYARLTSRELKEKVIFGVSQRRSAESQRWLLDLARNRAEPLELRKSALFWAGQGGVAIADLVALYDTMDDREMREQLIFVYSQRREREAVDKLMDIARRDPDRELRGKAIFWLGQSKDPRVAQFLLELINQ